MLEDNEWIFWLYGVFIYGFIGSNDVGKYIEEVLLMVFIYINSSIYGFFIFCLDFLFCF